MTDRRRSNSPSDLLAIPENSSEIVGSTDFPVFASSAGGLARRPLNILEAYPRSLSALNCSQSCTSFNGYNTSQSSSTSSASNVVIRRSSYGTAAALGMVRRNSNGYRRLSLSRDVAQPSTGSVTNLRCRSLPPESEEADVLGSLLSTQLTSQLLTTARPRSFTCPDLESRRVRTKIRNRPPTPPPSEIQLSDSSAEGLPLVDQSKLHDTATAVNLGRRSRHSSRDRLEMTGLEEMLPVISES